MAVPSSQAFDYEVTVHFDEAGLLQGTVVNRQAERGTVPGLAGLHPTATIKGDTLTIDSNPTEAPPHPVWEWMTLFIPFAHNAYVTRCLRAAQVRSFELELPGLMQHLKPGCVLRLMQVYAPTQGNPFSANRHCEVVLFEAERELLRWVSPDFSFAAW